MNRHQNETKAESCLVLGTERGSIFIVGSYPLKILASVSFLLYIIVNLRKISINLIILFAQATVPTAPEAIVTCGSFAVDYLLIVVCSDGYIYQLRRLVCLLIKIEMLAFRKYFINICFDFRGVKSVTVGIHPGASIIDIVRIRRTLIVACTDKRIRCFSLRVSDPFKFLENHLS